MNSTRKEQIELAIWKEIAGENLSVSHDHWHIDRVLDFASQLQSLHGGDLEVITASAILHDLGRDDPQLHGQESIERSIVRARKILERAGFSPGRIEQILQAIDEHDKPEISPSTIEGKILKDADFLAGFGAWGILRIGMWAGETGGGVSQILDRLERRMPKRLQNLEFDESDLLARKEMMFTGIFSELLSQPSAIPKHNWKGKYIILEGISGSGKDTQATQLHKWLIESGHTVLMVQEPADAYKDWRDVWKERHNKQLDDPIIMKFLLMADRYELIKEQILPALKKGHIVLSVRSYISTLVYQCADAYEVAFVGFSHHFVPWPDLVMVFDVDSNTAWNRIKDREHKGLYEQKELLEKHRFLYCDICDRIFGSRSKVIDASRPTSEVARESWKLLEAVLQSKL